MAKDINSFTCTCRLGQDPDVRYAASGTAIASFSGAVSGWDGKQETTTWLNFKAFNKTAEVIGNYLTKGSRVAITARYTLDQWEKDGQKFSKPVFLVNDLVMLDSKPKDGDSQERRPQGGPRGGGSPKNDYDQDIPFSASLV